ncbi:MAG: adenylate/guanylate cyclase domain-containing protein [Gammaproteobacteria bacterium]
MNDTGVTRRLAAVLAADVAGYSRLIQDDAEATVTALDAARALFRVEVDRAGGSVVDTAGDSVLAVFGSTTAAVRAAFAVQQGLDAGATAQPELGFLRFRIGIHLGELIEKADGSVYGDGVNVAARLQALARPGGVCVSAAVHEQLAPTLAADFRAGGRHELKNIARPVEIYLSGGETAARTPSRGADDRRPRVAVATFDATGDGAEALARGVRDALTTALANQTGIVVVAEENRAAFVVRAALQAAGGRYRANLHIVDRADGRQFGADRFEGALADPFAAEDELAYATYNAVRFALHAREMEAVRDATIDTDADTPTLLLRAGSLMFRSVGADYREARALLAAVLAREPENFMALAMYGNALLEEVICGYGAVSAADAAAAHACVARALRLRDDSDYVHFVASEVALHVDGDADTASAEARRSLELNPYYAFATTMLGVADIARGAAAEGVAACVKVLAAEPRLPFAGLVLQFAAFGCWVMGDHPAAMRWAREGERRAPGVVRTLLTLVAAAVEHGDSAAARIAAAQVLQIEPGFTVDDFVSRIFPSGDAEERYRAALRAAGLP